MHHYKAHDHLRVYAPLIGAQPTLHGPQKAMTTTGNSVDVFIRQRVREPLKGARPPEGV